jgi:hypothetical protein
MCAAQITVNTVPLTAYLERKHGVSRSTVSSWASDSSNFLYTNSISLTSINDHGLHHPIKLPQIVEDTVIAVRALPCWQPLNEQAGCWAITTCADPYGFLYWNQSWFEMFATSTNVILAASVCDGTVPVICLGDLITEDTDLSVVSKFCANLLRTGRGHCVVDLGPSVGLCSIHAFPLKSPTSSASSSSSGGASNNPTAASSRESPVPGVSQSLSSPALSSSPAPIPAPVATRDTTPIKHAHSFGSVLTPTRSSFTNSSGSSSNPLMGPPPAQPQPDFDCIAMQFTPFYDAPSISTVSNGTNQTSPSVAAALNEYRLRQQGIHSNATSRTASRTRSTSRHPQQNRTRDERLSYSSVLQQSPHDDDDLAHVARTASPGYLSGNSNVSPPPVVIPAATPQYHHRSGQEGSGVVKRTLSGSL